MAHWVYKYEPRGIVALVFRCRPEGGSEQLSDESRAVAWLTSKEIAERMGEVFAVRLLDAVQDDTPPHVRTLIDIRAGKLSQRIFFPRLPIWLQT